jgi:hypothetical protein
VKSVEKKLVCGFLIFAVLIVSLVALNQAAYRKATPPLEVKDVSSFLTWIKKPMGLFRVTAGKNLYFVYQGPAGRLPSSGTAAYAFDAKGQFIGWTPDMGDVKTPGAVFSSEAKWERIPATDLPPIEQTSAEIGEP